MLSGKSTITKRKNLIIKSISTQRLKITKFDFFAIKVKNHSPIINNFTTDNHITHLAQ